MIDVQGRVATHTGKLAVVKGQSSGRPWAERVFDLRVEDHPRPGSS